MASGAHLDLTTFDGQGLTNSKMNDIVFHTITASQKIHMTAGSNLPAKLSITNTGIGISNINPSVSLDIGTTDAVKFPVGTTAERPNNASAGMIRYNSTSLQFEGYSGGAWGGMGGLIDIDGNTYITAENSPGANNNQLKFYTNNTLAMTIDSNQSIGIGTTSPNSNVSLDINTTDAVKFPVGTTAERPNFPSVGMIRYNSTSLQFEGYSGGAWGGMGGLIDVDGNTYITAENSPGANNNQLKFYTNNKLAMTIDSNQSIGIGTTSPNSLFNLDIASNMRSMNITTPSLFIGNTNDIFNTNFYVTSNDIYYSYGNVGIGKSNPQFTLDVTGNVGFSNTLQVVGAVSLSNQLNVTGKIGIGTTNPNTALHIYYASAGLLLQDSSGVTANTTTAYIAFYNNISPTPTQNGWIGYSATGDLKLYNSSATTGGIRMYTNNTEKLTILNDGYVGIGTTVPSTALHITSFQPTLRLQDTNATTANTTMAYIIFYNNISPTPTVTGYIGYAGTGDIRIQNSSSTTGGIRMYTNSTERLTILNDGKVGIGTTTPSTALHIYDAYDLAIIKQQDATGTSTAIVANNSYYYGTTTGTLAGLIGYNNTADIIIGNYLSTGNIRMYVGGSASTNEKFTILNGGNVGIGTTTPNTTLHLYRVQPTVRLQDTNASNANATLAYLSFYNNISPTPTITGYIGYDGTSDLKIYNTSATTGGIRMYTNSLERLTILNGGYIGIGTTSPSNDLHIYAASASLRIQDSSATTANATVGYISFYNNITGGATQNGIIGYLSATGVGDLTISNNSTTTGGIRINTNSTERLTILNGGYVGIGTTNPTDDLHIYTANAGLRIQDSSATTANATNAYINFYNNKTGGATLNGYIGYNGTAGDIKISNTSATTGGIRMYTNDTERLTILNDGKIGIGTNAPSTALHIYDANDLAIIKQQDSTGTSTAIVANNSYYYGTTTGTLAGLIGYNNSADIIIGNYLSTGNVRINAGGSGITKEFFTILNTGNVGIGSTIPKSSLDINGSVNISGLTSLSNNLIMGELTKHYKIDFGSSSIQASPATNMTGAKLYFYYGSGTYTTSYAIGIEASALWYNSGNGSHKFYANGANVFNIDSTGDINLINGSLNINSSGTTPTTAGNYGINWWTNTSHATYMTAGISAASVLSFSGGAACSYNAGTVALRNRLPNADGYSFIWENSSEILLMGLTAGTGGLYVKNNVGIGVTNSSYNLQVTGTSYFSGDATFATVINATRGSTTAAPGTAGNVGERIILYNAGGGTYNLSLGIQGNAMWFNVGASDSYLFYSGGSPTFYISNVGAVQAKGTITGSIATPSDYRIKKNIIPIEDKFIDKINTIRCVEFEYKKVKDSIFNGEHLQNTYGFIAHELQDIFPNCVSGEKDEIDNEGKEIYQSINLFPIITILTKGMQELSSENKLLKTEINDLKLKLNNLYNYLNIDSNM